MSRFRLPKDLSLLFFTCLLCLFFRANSFVLTVHDLFHYHCWSSSMMVKSTEKLLQLLATNLRMISFQLMEGILRVTRTALIIRWQLHSQRRCGYVSMFNINSRELICMRLNIHGCQLSVNLLSPWWEKYANLSSPVSFMKAFKKGRCAIFIPILLKDTFSSKSIDTMLNVSRKQHGLHSKCIMSIIHRQESLLTSLILELSLNGSVTSNQK